MVMGVISNPRVPETKQVNLYQNGFLSWNSAAELAQGAGIDLSPQIGTLDCEKVVEPQTGKAVPGFCPKAVHVCPKPLAVISRRAAKKNFFIATGVKIIEYGC